MAHYVPTVKLKFVALLLCSWEQAFGVVENEIPKASSIEHSGKATDDSLPIHNCGVDSYQMSDQSIAEVVSQSSVPRLGPVKDLVQYSRLLEGENEKMPLKLDSEPPDWIQICSKCERGTSARLPLWAKARVVYPSVVTSRVCSYRVYCPIALLRALIDIGHPVTPSASDYPELWLSATPT